MSAPLSHYKDGACTSLYCFGVVKRTQEEELGEPTKNAIVFIQNLSKRNRRKKEIFPPGYNDNTAFLLHFLTKGKHI